VYGFLDLSEDQQFLRIKPLEEPLGLEENQKLDVRVKLKNLKNGITHHMADSVIVFTDEQDTLYTHNFRTDASIQPKTEYELSVIRNGQAVTEATTRTPVRDAATITPVDTPATPQSSDETADGDLTVKNCLTTFRIQFTDAFQNPLRVFGTFYYENQAREVRIDRLDHVEIQNPEGSDPFVDIVPEDDLLSEEIPQKDQTDLPFDPRYVPRCSDLDRRTIEFRYIYASPDWKELLPDPSSPGSLIRYVEETQIDNGHGFFGALNRGQLSTEVNITADTLIVGDQ